MFAEDMELHDRYYALDRVAERVYNKRPPPEPRPEADEEEPKPCKPS